MDNVDQRRFDNQHRETMTARDAARFLDVKLSTLYAYTSRGLLRSIPVEGARARRYLRAEVERLKARHDARAGHAAVAAGALRWGEPVLDTHLTRIDSAGPHYRNRPAIELARKGVSFEAVAELLWTGNLPPGRPPMTAPDAGLRTAAVRSLIPPGTPPLDVLTVVAPLLAVADPLRHAAPREAELVRARQLLRRLTAALALPGGGECVRSALAAPSLAAAALSAFGKSCSRRAEGAVNALLIICADHELNPSSFAARLTASTGADLYACVSAGLAAMGGPRHGAACDRVEAFVEEVSSPRQVAVALQERMRRGDEIHGFGHPLYPAGDPRAVALLEMANQLGRRVPKVRIVQEVVRIMVEGGYGKPSLELGQVAVTAALGLPKGAATALFALGRTAGWVAHALEQREAGFVLRPRARFVPEQSA
jgi:citrate synthase